MPKVKVKFDKKNLVASLAKYAGATESGMREALIYGAGQIAKNAQKEMLLIVGQGKKGKARNVSTALQLQRQSWEERIISGKEETATQKKQGIVLERTGMRLPRKKIAVSMLQKAHMDKTTALRYKEKALEHQGELASAWNATLNATNTKPVSGTSKVYKGTEHGDFSISQRGNVITAKITARFQGKDNFDWLARRAVDLTAKKIDTQSRSIIRGKLKKAVEERAGKAS